MLSIFTTNDQPISSVIHPPKFALVERTYRQSIDKVCDYYRKRNFVTQSNHPLAQALTLGCPPIHYELDRFIELAFFRGPLVSRHLKFSSSLIYGKMFFGTFFGDGNIEYIISDDHRFDVAAAVANWEEIRALRVIEHPFTDLSLNNNNGLKSVSGKGVCILTVNLPLLFLQFRCYVQQIESTNVERSILTNRFIQQYVIPNMLYSYTDLSIINRLFRKHYNEPLDTVLRRPVFNFIRNEPLLDDVLDEIYHKLKDNGLTYPTALSNIPSIRADSAKQALMLPDIAETRQVWWLIMRSRLRIIKGLIDIGGAEGLAKNTNYIAELKTLIKRLESQRIFGALLPYFDYDRMRTVIDDIKKL